MTPIQECIKNKNHKTKPIWIMRQAGRYLPEFREIRIKNPDFVKLCLDEITVIFFFKNDLILNINKVIFNIL